MTIDSDLYIDTGASVTEAELTTEHVELLVRLRQGERICSRDHGHLERLGLIAIGDGDVLTLTAVGSVVAEELAARRRS